MGLSWAEFQCLTAVPWNDAVSCGLLKETPTDNEINVDCNIKLGHYPKRYKIDALAKTHEIDGKC